MSRSTQRNQRKKSSEANREDRITNLPEGVISHILSRLPTKDAVRTCVLSKDWEYKWTHIYNIRIYDGIYNKRSRTGTKTVFVNFLERLLLLSQNVKSFQLSLSNKYALNRMTAWISAVLMRNVENFELTYLKDGIVLPRGLLNCTSLRKLKLRLLSSTFRVPTENCFPNLAILHLEGVEILYTPSSTEPLKFIFPVLETCVLKKCKWSNVKIVELYAPALTIFKSHPPEDAQVNDYSIKIHGAKLIKFESSSNVLETFDMSNSRIAYATLLNSFRKYGPYLMNRDQDDLQLLEKGGLQVRMLLKGFSCLKELELSGDVAKAIAQSKHGVPLSRYNTLERLVIFSGSGETLLELLQAAPSLKYLVINEGIWVHYDYDAVQVVPMCISNSLEEVKFNSFDFSGKKPEFYLAEFLLKNAILLKKMHLHCAYRTAQENKIVEELSTVPTNSARCVTIVVT
ncbi:hypothetical protein ACJIZ3_014945 [Penstemon smallii]|uniref:F-box domain-containing protein n=1 Tax=Penstemon smallii TaxID=265156 RepID=A0ABD3RL33_9LAMI